MDYEEIKEKEGTWIAINQALIDCLKGEITGGDFMDILNDLHPIASDGVSADVSKCDCENVDDIKPYYDIDEDIFRCNKCDKHFC